MTKRRDSSVLTCALDAKLSTKLRLFSRATGGTKAAIIRMALDEYIDRSLRDNSGWRKRFEQHTLEDAALGTPVKHLRVIK